MKKVEVFFDYACPFCYIGLHQLKEVAKDYPDIEFEWRACEAHPVPEPAANMEEMKPFWDKTLRPMALKEGVTLHDTVSPVPHSNVAFRGMHELISLGKDVVEYHKNVYQSMFIDQKNIEDIEVLMDCVQGLDISKEDFRKALASQDRQRQQEKANEYAYIENKIEAVPTLIARDKRLDAIPAVGITREGIKEFLDEISHE